MITFGKRRTERIFLLLITIFITLFCYRLYTVMQVKFVDVDSRIKGGTMVNLNAKNPAVNLRNLLEKGYYFDDPKDIDLIEATVAGADRTLDNIGELNKRRYYILADDAFEKGGKSFKARVTASRSLLGYTGDDLMEFEQERKNPEKHLAQLNLGLGENAINGIILEQERPIFGVLVRLDMI